MPIGNWTFDDDEELGVFFLYRNGISIGVFSYSDNEIDLSKDQLQICIQELIDLHDLGKPYLQALNPNMLDDV